MNMYLDGGRGVGAPEAAADGVSDHAEALAELVDEAEGLLAVSDRRADEEDAGHLGVRVSLTDGPPRKTPRTLVDSSSEVRSGAPARQPFASSDSSASLKRWRAADATLPSKPVASSGG